MLKKHAVTIWNLGIALLFIWLAVTPGALKDHMEYWGYDMMMGLGASPDTPGPIVLVDVDDRSLETLGPWPWPRSRMAEGIRAISAAGARVMGLPLVLHAAQESVSTDALAGLAAVFDGTFGTVDDPKLKAFYQTLQDVRKQLNQDQVLADAIAAAGNVVLPVDFIPSPEEKTNSAPSFQLFTERALEIHGVSPGLAFPRRQAVRLPLPAYLQGVRQVGHLEITRDRDGRVRRAETACLFQGRTVASFAVSLGAAYLNIPGKDLQLIAGHTLSLDGRRLPLSADGDFLVRFYRGAGAFDRYSFADVIAGTLPPGILSDRLVVFNFSATGLAPRAATPVDAAMPMGELTAHTLRTILQQTPLRPAPYSPGVNVLLAVLAGLIITLWLPRLSVAKAGLFTLGILTVLAGGSFFLFRFQDIWFQAVQPALEVLAGFLGTTIILWVIPGAGPGPVGQAAEEMQRLKGLALQSQGMLDESWDQFRPLPVDDSLKTVLYDLAIDFEKNGEPNKALMIYEHIELQDADFKDIQTRMRRLIQSSETIVMGEDDMPSVTDTDPATQAGPPPPAEAAPVAGEKPAFLGRYKLIKPIGQGAMGTVYLGQDPHINRETALKTYRFDEEYDPADAEKMKQRFFREAESAGKLSHPGIVTIFDAGEQDQLAYIAMEYLEGQDLREHLKKGVLLPIRKVIDYVADIAEALAYAHRNGVVHRDVKPANIMLLKVGAVKITDFGIARIMASSKTRTGVVKGTPYYMAPEQITGKKVDGRCDIFSLGVVLFQLLTGRLPFTANSPGALLHKIVNEPHPDPRSLNPGIYKPLAMIIDKALAKDITRRYQDAGRMAAHLRQIGQKIDAVIAQKKQKVTADGK